jgi:hypothetical protein
MEAVGPKPQEHKNSNVESTEKKLGPLFASAFGITIGMKGNEEKFKEASSFDKCGIHLKDIINKDIINKDLMIELKWVVRVLQRWRFPI